MIARVAGTVVAKDEDCAIIDVNGVGYQLFVCADELEALVIDSPGLLWVHTSVREDAITLFGFVQPLRRQVFAKLITLHGVGPKLALAILSTFELPKLRELAIKHDAKALRQVPGVGPKGAQRLALELEAVFAGLDIPSSSTSTSKRSAATLPISAEVRSALVNLGFAEASALAAIQQAEQDAEQSLDFDQLLRRALGLLHKR